MELLGTYIAVYDSYMHCVNIANHIATLAQKVSNPNCNI